MRTAAIQCVLLCAIAAHAQDLEWVDEVQIPLAAVPQATTAQQQRAPHLPADLVGLPATVVPVDAAIDADPPQVGYVLPAPVGVLEEAQWQLTDDGGLVLRLELHSPDAAGLRVQLEAPIVSNGLELRVYEPAGTTVLGPFTVVRSSEDRTWWTPTILGDTLGLELYLPPHVEIPGELPRVLSVAYKYCTSVSNCATGPGSPMGCHNDVTCYSSWANGPARAVGAMSFISGTGCFVCTGALLNRGPGDYSPLFMTANHCISTQAEARTLEVRWFYQTSTCNGTPPAFGSLAVTSGALVLKRHTDSDWTLLGLAEPPVGDYYLGWSSGDWGSGDDATGIHHPRGSFKRISFGESDGSTSNATFCDPNGQNCFDADVWDVDFDDGTTEPGSSGSPIFDSSSRVRGTLSGGESGCAPNTKRYGRLDLAYVNLRYYMSNTYVASPMYVHWGVGGDPGNNGSSEQGTTAQPFNTVYEASFAVRGGDDLNIMPGSYNERFRIWRPMTLKRWGGSGVVRIGE